MVIILVISHILHRNKVLKKCFINIILSIFTFAPCMLLYLFYSNQLMHSF